MASGLGGIFDQGKQQGPAMAAPGIPAGALSGNPVASFVNVGMATGANVGANLVGALGGLAGLPQANPAMMVQQRQQEFGARLQQVMADGTVTQGDAIKQVAQDMFKEKLLPGNEYLKAIQEASLQKEKDNKLLSEHTDFVRKSDAFENYSKSTAIFRELQETVKRGKAGEQSANDYVLIQQGLKILDPGSIVSDNEIRSGKFAANGRQQLRIAGVDLAALSRYAAGNGQAIELTPLQKEKWLKAISAAVDSQRNQLETVYLTGRQGYTAAGGAEGLFDKSLATAKDLLGRSAYKSVDELAARGLISHGRGFNTNMGMLKAGVENAAEAYAPLIDVAKTAAVEILGVTGSLLFGSDEPSKKPRGKRAPRMGRGTGGKDKLPEFGGADNSLGRLLSPKLVEDALMASYRTDNPIHAQIFDGLNNSRIEDSVNKALWLRLNA